jgi:hypothetical protein
MRRLQITTVLLLGTMAAFLTGCSKSPMSPDLSSRGGAASMAGFQIDDPPAPVDGGIPAEAKGTFDSTSEGRLTVGRFTLDLHKNTLQMPATITLRVSSEDATDVEIEVVPAEANDFQVAAELWANMSDLPDTDYSNTTFFSWENENWKDQEGSPHSNMQAMVAKMKHLSTSRVGTKSNKSETIQPAQ